MVCYRLACALQYFHHAVQQRQLLSRGWWESVAGSEVGGDGVGGRPAWGRRSPGLGSEVAGPGVGGRPRRGRRSAATGSEVGRHGVGGRPPRGRRSPGVGSEVCPSPGTPATAVKRPRGIAKTAISSGMARRLAYITLALIAGAASPAAAQLRADTLIRGLRNPVAIVADPTHSSTFLIVEQRGIIHAARDGHLLSDPFLDLTSEISTGGERGLLGLALAPDYASSRRFFVNFTNRDGHTVIARFVRREDDALRADAASRFDLSWPNGRRYIDQPFSNHNGGHLLFGPDQYLYVGLGDGGGAGDPMNHAQRGDSLLGKMLRIDVAVADDDRRGYRIPEDNPFLDGDPMRALDEIWAFGLRNPWRYSFDDWTRGGTSALLIGDVGQNAREEINFEPHARGARN